MAKFLVNVTEQVRIELTDELLMNPSSVAAMLKAEGYPPLGVVQLSVLFEGKVEEKNGYMVIEEDVTEITTKAIADQATTETTIDSDSSKQQSMNDELEELLSEPSATEVEEVKSEEVKVEEKAIVKKSIADDAAAGVVAAKESPKATSAPRRRADRKQLEDKLLSDVATKDLVEKLNAGGFEILSIDSKARWFSVVHNSHEIKAASPRIDISPRKNGDFGLSVYIDNKAAGLKEVVKASEKTSVDCLAWVQSADVSPKLKKA